MGVQDEGTNNRPPTYKTRLVACGCKQREGIDYKESFAPIVRSRTIRTFVALATQHESKLYHLDVKITFLNGNLQEKVFMGQ